VTTRRGDTADRYELRVDGHLDERWSPWFAGLTLTHEDDGTTTLRGAVTDQAELHGHLARVRDLGATLLSVLTPTLRGPAPELPLYRVHLMRAGYLLMGVGLAVVKWPQLASADSLPVFEGVVTCLLVALSLLALLGLRYPVKLLPVLLFESAWKLIWLAAVALPRAAAGELDAATQEVLVSCSLVVVIVVVTPWRYVWREYVRAGGDRWR